MEEYIDILNEDGSFAGFSCPRSKVHTKGLWHRTVHIWAFDSQKNILFQRRSLKKENHPGLLDTSCAGHITAGDSSINSAIRELREELSISKDATSLEYIFEGMHNSIMNESSYIDREFYDVYKITLSAKEIESLVPQYGEVEDFVWFSRDDLQHALLKNPEKFVSHPKDFEWLLKA